MRWADWAPPCSGIPHVFFVPAVLALLGTVGLALTGRHYRPGERAFTAATALHVP